MTEILRMLVLGILQGLTEFLPVSSSGHLELAKWLMKDSAVGEESLVVTVVLHLATALATIVVFRKDIAALLRSIVSSSDGSGRKYAGLIVLSMIPAVAVGLGMEDWIESLFAQRLQLVGGCLIATAALLYLADRHIKNDRKPGFLDVIIIGIAQAIAILPGISRSGATIATSVLLSIDRTEAARFSFLMVIPLIFGKIAKDVLTDDWSDISLNYLALGVGFIAAFIAGIIACQWMIKLVQKSGLRWFGLYCLIIGSLAIFLGS